MTGIVYKGIGGFYYVWDEAGVSYTLRAQSKLRRAHMTPMVGDRVDFQPGVGDEDGWLTAILPRRNALIRPPVANIDRLCVVVAAGTPAPDVFLVDRLLLLARQSAMDALLIVNKVDESPERARAIGAQYRGAGIGVCAVSAQTGEGIPELRERLAGTIHAFGGQSGVGKSTLINALYGFSLQTGDISDRIERGRHTTRHSELMRVANHGMVLDTPGFSLLTTDLVAPESVRTYYPEFEPYEGQCRFTPCLHGTEPGCAVRAAVAEGVIDGERYERYRIYLSETKERWRQRYD